MSHSLTSIDLICTDLDASAEFYAALLGELFARRGTGPDLHYEAHLPDGSVVRLRRRSSRSHKSPTDGATVGFGIRVDELAPLRVMRTGADVLGGMVARDPDGNHVTMVVVDS